ncbi:Uncharacterised protein [Mycobacteroides abscessus subsp. massiliense]|nr:Uncharacterised protein [Mycobacteroides abscessus subsp. massiliense]
MLIAMSWTGKVVSTLTTASDGPKKNTSAKSKTLMT